MSREWSDLFILADGAAGVAPDPPGDAAHRTERAGSGFLGRLRESLGMTRRALSTEIQATLAETPDEEAWERLEEALIMADVGATTTAEVVSRLEAEARDGRLEGGEARTRRLVELLAEIARSEDDRIDLRARPAIILMVGVNGTGKTTTVGKLAWNLHQRLGRRVLLGAADTFRAAGTEQLQRWGERADCDVVSAGPGSDPGSVAFDTLVQARSRDVDVVLMDTAGRLHTQDDLMAELAKVRRVITKQAPGAPHETLLTVDATTGQNGLRQARLFAESAGVTGIALTKLDGTAKGGIAIAIARDLAIPVKLIGVGEGVEDLRPFDADDFARALVS